MNDALFVRGFEGLADLARVIERLVERERTGQRLAVHQLHHQRPFFDPVDGCDVRMIQRGQHLRFALEAGEAVGIGSESVGKDFDGDFASELGVGGAPDLAHAPFAELRDDSEVCDRLLRAHRVVQGMVSLSGRITCYAEVMPVLCPPVDVRWRSRPLPKFMVGPNAINGRQAGISFPEL
jgi:hypothetical protein